MKCRSSLYAVLFITSTKIVNTFEVWKVILTRTTMYRVWPHKTIQLSRVSVQVTLCYLRPPPPRCSIATRKDSQPALQLENLTRTTKDLNQVLRAMHDDLTHEVWVSKNRPLHSTSQTVGEILHALCRTKLQSREAPKTCSTWTRTWKPQIPRKFRSQKGKYLQHHHDDAASIAWEAWGAKQNKKKRIAMAIATMWEVAKGGKEGKAELERREGGLELIDLLTYLLTYLPY